METGLQRLGERASVVFPAYLQGMETQQVAPVCPAIAKRSQPTYKEWKPRAGTHPNTWRMAVPSLPTRNGNGPVSENEGHTGLVPSLPTRNGNLCECFRNDGRGTGSQPTYKEWKPATPYNHAGLRLVPSLPTRNGNQRCSRSIQPRTSLFPAYLQGMETYPIGDHFNHLDRFPAYLQGMETPISNQPSPPLKTSFPAYLQGMETHHRAQIQCAHQQFPAYLQGMETESFSGRYGLHFWLFPAYLQGMETEIAIGLGVTNHIGSQPTYKEWKPLRVFSERGARDRQVPSLPTRNGNLCTLLAIRHVSMRFPAYLQGMETEKADGLEMEVPLRSQPTYKEWKRVVWGGVYGLHVCSQPTYKEWKQTSLQSRPPIHCPGSQPTYKEWKPGPGNTR